MQSIGIQEYLGPGDPRGTRILCEVMRSLGPHAAAAGIPVLSAAWGRKR